MGFSHHRPLIGRFALAPPGRRARPTSWNRFATRSLDISRSMPLHPRSSTSESDEAEKIGRQSQRSPDRIPNLRRRARTSVDIKVEPASPPTRTPSPVPIYPSPSLMNSPSEEVPMALIPVSPIVFESNLDLPLLERPTYKSPTSTPTTSEIITPPRSKTISLPPFHCPGDQRLGDRQVIDRAVDVGDQMQTRTVPLMSDHQAFTRAVRRVQEALSALANSLEPSPTTVEREAQVPDVGITVTTEDVSAADDHAFFQAWDVSLGEASTEATNSDAFDSPTNPSASPHEPLATSNVDRVSQSSKSLPMPTGPPIPLAFGKCRSSMVRKASRNVLTSQSTLAPKAPLGRRGWFRSSSPLNQAFHSGHPRLLTLPVHLCPCLGGRQSHCESMMQRTTFAM